MFACTHYWVTGRSGDKKMIIEAIQEFLGDVPKGYEVLEYVLGGTALLFIVRSAFIFLGSVFGRLSEL